MEEEMVIDNSDDSCEQNEYESDASEDSGNDEEFLIYISNILWK